MAVDSGLSWAFVAVGAAAQGFAFLLARRPLRLIRAGGRARGVVTDNQEEIVSSGRGSPRHYFMPVISFTTGGGERIVFKSISGGKNPLPKDSEVDVLYDPAKPQEAALASFGHLWFFPLATAVAGAPFLIAGVYGLL